MIECNVVVAGSGMAGMNAAIEAARAGASVVVLEKDQATGGNSKWAGGFDVESATYERMRAENPEGDPVLQKVLVDRFLQDILYLKGLGLDFRTERVGEHGDPRFNYLPQSGEGGIRVFRILQAHLEEAGGTVLLETALKSLVTGDSGEIVGVMGLGPEGPLRISCDAVVLATGSFTRNTDLKLRFFGPTGDRTGYYGSDHHDGDGIIAALELGAALSTGISVGQGMCVFPPPFQAPAGLYRLGGSTGLGPTGVGPAGGAQGGPGPGADQAEDPAVTSEPVPAGVQNLIVGPPCKGDLPVILVNLDGKRYVDESSRYTVIGWKTTCQPLGTGFCIFDQDVYGAQAPFMETALEWGAVIYKADSIEALAEQLRGWRVSPSYVEQVDAGNVVATVRDFNEAVAEERCPELHPPRRANRARVARPPFYAAPVVQGVVDSVGGIKIDGEARVLDRGGRPIPGLYAAGADAGRAYTVEHGGIAFALIFGRIAGANAARLARER